MVHVVLGMHKSGTTLVSEMLHHSGIDMGSFEPGTGYDEGNTYERAEVRAVNKAVLEEAGVTSHALEMPETFTASEEIRSRMEVIVQDREQQGGDWGFKDPRAAITYPLWREVLPAHRLVVVFRPLQELARRYGGDTSVKRAYAVVGAWYQHNRRLLSHVESASVPWIVISYPRLMEGDIELRRLESFLGRPVTDRRQPKLRRGRERTSLPVRLAEVAYLLKTRRWARSLLPRLEELSVAGPVPVLESPAP